MFDFINEDTSVALIGLFGGLLLGLAARRGRFCTLGAIEDYFYGDSVLRLKMWGVALGLAITGTFAASALGYLDLTETLYLSRGWNPLASILGGLTFGYGMALAGNCGYGALARLGGGDLRSFVIVLVMGISAYITLGGPLAKLRLTAFPITDEPTQTPSIAFWLSERLSLTPEIIGMTLGIALLAYSLLNREMRADPKAIRWSLIAGLAIVTGWIGTHYVAQNGFASTQTISHTFSAPIGESILYVMTSSGNSISFGTGSVAGVLIGACLGSISKGHFRWEACEDPRELRRQIIGAALMGFGAVIAVGCSVGQGLSAFSVLAFSAPITLAAIFAGAALGLRQLIVGFAPIPRS